MRDWPRQFDAHRVVFAGETAVVGQLAKARPIRTHGIELLGHGSQPERITARIEQQRPRHWVLLDGHVERYPAAGRQESGAIRPRGTGGRETGELVNVPAEPIDAEELRYVLGVPADGIRRRVEDDVLSIAEARRESRVRASVVRELKHLVSVPDEYLPGGPGSWLIRRAIEKRQREYGTCGADQAKIGDEGRSGNRGRLLDEAHVLTVARDGEETRPGDGVDDESPDAAVVEKEPLEVEIVPLTGSDGDRGEGRDLPASAADGIQREQLRSVRSVGSWAAIAE